MRRQALTRICASCRQTHRARRFPRAHERRYVQIRATPSSTEPQQSLDPSPTPGSTSSADARFEVIGGTFSLLSATISPSQNLYTRKGTLVGFNGKPENAISTLSLLEPFRRAVVGIPFIYQKTSSTTPYTALIATKSPVSSLAVVHLDGRLDWMIAQRKALLAWTGHTLRLQPQWNVKLSLAHWGSTAATGRGLLALSGIGSIHQIILKTGEEYVVHPSNVIAYSVTPNVPQPYRFKSNSLKLQIPNPLTWFPDTRFWRTMRESTAWSLARKTAFSIRTWTRRTIWGDRLFLHFQGPVTILLQSRASTISDSLTSGEVNEIADSPAGAVSAALAKPSTTGSVPTASAFQTRAPKPLSYASVGSDGAVKFEKS